jgi:hypothetical protein
MRRMLLLTKSPLSTTPRSKLSFTPDYLQESKRAHWRPVEAADQWCRRRLGHFLHEELDEDDDEELLDDDDDELLLLHEAGTVEDELDDEELHLEDDDEDEELHEELEELLLCGRRLRYRFNLNSHRGAKPGPTAPNWSPLSPPPWSPSRFCVGRAAVSRGSGRKRSWMNQV